MRPTPTLRRTAPAVVLLLVLTACSGAADDTADGTATGSPAPVPSAGTPAPPVVASPPDPLAAATIFDDRICGFRPGAVDVELGSERLGGVTYWSPADPSPRHEVALDVDAPRFFEHYFATLNR